MADFGEKPITEKRFQWIILAKMLAEQADRIRRGVLADQVVVELMVVPESEIPDTPQKMWFTISRYIEYAYGQKEKPEWYQDEWIGWEW